jgi:hypothetical protein
MTPETKKYFIKGLRIAIKSSGRTQKEFAQGVTSPVNLSRILRKTSGLSEDMANALAKKAGSDVMGIARIGEQEEVGQKPVREAVVKNKSLDVSDFLLSATTLVSKLNQIEDDLGLWKEVFEILPFSAFIIENKLVTYQNVKSRSLGNMIGGPLCENCAGKNCKDPEMCPMFIATETASPQSGYQVIAGKRCRVDIVPFRRKNTECYLVVAMKAEFPSEGELDRRARPDRRRSADNTDRQAIGA